MALYAYLRLAGTVQGEIKGSVTQKGREGSIRVIAYHHKVVSPRDAASGLPTGRRQHHPVAILKEIDASSPLLMKMLVNNENITTWELRFWQPLPTGVESQYFTIRLHNAAVIGIRQEMRDVTLPENMQLKERELVTFSYQQITWTHEGSGNTCEDDWEAPAV